MDIKLDHPSPVEEKPQAVEEPHSVEDGMFNIIFILCRRSSLPAQSSSEDMLRFCGDAIHGHYYSGAFLCMGRN